MIPAKEYIHIPTIGDIDRCLAMKTMTKQALDEAYDRLALQGYLLLLIRSETDIEDNLIFSDYKQHAGNKFPFIYAIIQPTDDENDIDTFMQGLGYSRVTPGYIDERH